ncbi:nitroreductase family protein [Botrimarina sp.]|uniref:nitroreductase family protein n=1 Tax=Botrimarina sp. TaxID=2795802 RepID=UPI0032EDE5EC
MKSLLLYPLRKVKRWLLSDPVMTRVWAACVRWPWLADLYYCVSSQFRREHRAVLQGKLEHTRGRRTGAEGAEYTLRRNTHRLEKGLIMRPRRDVFATGYIDEAVDAYRAVCSSPAPDPTLVDWATDVLTEYFSVVGADETVDAARTRFEAVPRAHRPEDARRLVPYRRDTDTLKADYDAMLQLAVRRRSVRWYLDKPVPRELIDRAIDVAKLSPSACNRQPFLFHIFDDPRNAARIGSIPMGTAGFSQNFPCLIVIVGDLSAYFSERDRHVIYVDGGLAAMALQFALEVQGVSSCCINWPDIPQLERQMAEALDLPRHHRPIMCMSLGYADPEGNVPFSQKKSLNEIRRYRDPPQQTE